ncbi:MAG: hypothetical protein IAG13_09865, partial [Deltaproteobacteria bacterium]|nr:hypothetical protein [Nannocystaceae bacterium]
MIAIEPSRALFERTTERLAAYFGLPSLDPALSWQRAGRIIAARLVLALAREQLVDAELRGGALVLAGGTALPLRSVRALELHDPELTEPRASVLEHPVSAWQQLAASIALPEGARERIATELADGVPRLALAVWVAAMRQRHRGLIMRPYPSPLDGEDLVVVGHPWHPMAKTRLGLGWAENLRHAPELFGVAPIAAIELPSADVHVHGDAIELLRPWLGAPAPEHVRIPVHRAQLARLL